MKSLKRLLYGASDDEIKNLKEVISIVVRVPFGESIKFTLNNDITSKHARY